MDERLLRKLSMLGVGIGMVILVFISSLAQGCTDIGSISIEDVGAWRTVCGDVDSVYITKGHIFFDISDETSKIKFVIFNSSIAGLDPFGVNLYNIKTGTPMNASGIVEEYPSGSGKLQIVYKRGNIFLE